MTHRVSNFLLPFLLAVTCTRLGPEKQWGNPLDPTGTNWHPPRVTAMGDTTVAINDIVGLRASGFVENGRIVSYAWSFDSGATWDRECGAEGVLPMSWTRLEAGRHRVLVRAYDSNGLVSSPDTLMVEVREYAPVLDKMRDTVAGQQAVVLVSVTARDTNGVIEKYYWGSVTGGWADSTGAGTREFSNPSGGPVRVVWGARDNDGILLCDTFTILFNRGPQRASISAGEGSTVAFRTYRHVTGKGSISLQLHGEDPDGAADTLLYKFSVQADGTDMRPVHTGRDTTAILDSLAPGVACRWRLVVTDLFGDSAVGEGRFVVGNAPPPPRGKLLVRVPADPFLMGSSGGRCVDCPVHPVRISHHFWIDSTEVTEAAYREALGLPPSPGSALPASGVTWYDAALYCNARSKSEGLDTVYGYAGIEGRPGLGCVLDNVGIDTSAGGYRLPTEAQWEYAARAGSTHDFFWGDDPGLVHEYAWYRDNSGNALHPVGTKHPNKLGLFDICGNVWEWCQDWYGADYYYTTAAAQDPEGPVAGTERVVRGGGYNASDHYAALGVRGRFRPDLVNPVIGFRTVLPEK